MRGTTFASVGAEGIYERLYPFVSLSGTSGANGCHIKYPSYADAMSILAYLYATWQAFIDKRNFRVLLSVFEFIGVIAYILYVAKFVGLLNHCKSAMPIGWGSDHALLKAYGIAHLRLEEAFKKSLQYSIMADKATTRRFQMICTTQQAVPIVIISNTSQETHDITPLFIQGDALHVLRHLPDNSIDFCMTSPPYWNKRQYNTLGIGLEERFEDYISHLLGVFEQVQRTLKPSGSFWLNIGDSYLNKSLLGIPWRVALKMVDEQGWILRNDIVWNKVKGGMDNTKDRLGNIHESIFHFVKQRKGYYYDADSIRTDPRKARVENGSVISATGVSGVRYKRQIELSTALNEKEKNEAAKELEKVLGKIKAGEIADFRMIIRGQQRTTHSNSEKISGRAKELKEKGFYFLMYHPHGSKPGDVWDILPEDTQKRDEHFAPFPEDLCKIPILATCPQQGIVLDPFCGTGTTMFVAQMLKRKSIGIDISGEYLQIADNRCKRGL